MFKKLNKEQMCQVERIDYCLGNGILSPKKKTQDIHLRATPKNTSTGILLEFLVKVNKPLSSGFIHFMKNKVDIVIRFS